MRWPAIAALALAALLAFPAAAVQPDEMLPDAALEQRAREISRTLRCVVCQNQSIDDSDAPLARDLRLLVRERLVEGDDDAAVYDFVVARYGDFVLLRPPVRPSTWLLWFGPAAMLVVGSVGIALWFRRRRAGGGLTSAATLTAAERATVARVLARDGEQGGG